MEFDNQLQTCLFKVLFMKYLPIRIIAELKFNLWFFVGWTCFSLACTPSSNMDEATMIFKGGTIYTQDAENPIAGALAIKDSLILFVGLEEEVDGFIGPQTRIIDFSGKIMTPGWIEGHGHFMEMGYSQLNLDLSTAATYEEIVARVKEATANTIPGQWIIGHSWHQSKWETQPDETVNGLPLHNSLSISSPDHPVVLFHVSGHALLANAKAMEIAKIGPLNQEMNNHKKLAGGEIIRDKNGNPTGIFNENAMDLIIGHLPENSLERNIQAFNLAQKACHSKGITGFHDAGVSQETLNFYQKLHGEGQLKTRMYLMLAGNDKDLLEDWYHKGPLIDPMLTVRSIKLMADGALGTRGAWLLEEYSDQSGHFGHETMPMSEVYQTALKGIEHGFQIATHAIGDKANQEVLNQYQKAFETTGSKGNQHRFRIEHVQHLHPEDIPRFAQLGIIPSMQAIHLSSDRPWAIDRLGKKRILDGAYVWQALLATGTPLINGTDVPVEPLSPIENFYASVTRKTLKGEPESGYEPEQKMTREQALKSYTLSPAFGAFEEKIKGSIATGKLADLVILNQDIMKIKEDQILNTNVMMTIIGGEIVYQHEE
ncbi:amidohydrolase [Cyclobacterium marinum]|nr:amidohydrolase [Cyclobacterium marinum]